MQVLALVTLVALAVVAATQNVLELTNDNFDQQLARGEWMVECACSVIYRFYPLLTTLLVYAPWCGYCSRFAPEYERAAKELHELGKKVRLGKVNVDKENIVALRFMVSKLPTLYHVKNQIVRPASIKTSTAGVVEYIGEQQWKTTKPWPHFSSPFGWFGQMMIVVGIVSKYTSGYVDSFSAYMPKWVMLATAGLLVLGVAGIAAFVLPATPSAAERFKKTDDDELRHTAQPVKKSKESPVVRRRRVD